MFQQIASLVLRTVSLVGLNYIEARIYEEIKLPDDARKLYLKITKTASTGEDKPKAFRRIAWLYFTSEDYKSAVDYFEMARQATQSLLEQNSFQALPNKTRRALYDELDHALFWKGMAVAKASKTESLPKETVTLWKKLINTAPQSYYAMLAAARTSNQISSISKAGDSDVGEDDIDDCQVNIDSATSRRLALLQDGNLFELTKHEINWHVNEQFLKSNKSSSAQIHAQAAKASLLLKYARVSDAITRADMIAWEQRSGKLSNEESNLNDDVSRACIKLAQNLAYPTPLSSVFKREAKLQRVPVSLLLAIARTESHFDPKAVSSKGAQGLLQLMPKVATMEGLKEDEDIFSPEVNIRLGAKHFAGLLRTYNTQTTLALAAYNAGSAAVNRWQERFPKLPPEAWTELIGYPETKNYVKKTSLAAFIYKKKLSS